MPGNWHVRFGERRAETSRREAVWRCTPTLPVVFRARDHRGLDGDGQAEDDSLAENDERVGLLGSVLQLSS